MMQVNKKDLEATITFFSDEPATKILCLPMSVKEAAMQLNIAQGWGCESQSAVRHDWTTIFLLRSQGIQFCHARTLPRDALSISQYKSALVRHSRARIQCPETANTRFGIDTMQTLPTLVHIQGRV